MILVTILYWAFAAEKTWNSNRLNLEFAFYFGDFDFALGNFKPLRFGHQSDRGELAEDRCLLRAGCINRPQ